ncbi:hypothetical protein FO519_005629 [Halicephalobus sp. NKZ332]|nr:hypothetical protein FO519_005629 [Halicephalobus sp. NKZ332]
MSFQNPFPDESNFTNLQSYLPDCENLSEMPSEQILDVLMIKVVRNNAIDLIVRWSEEKKDLEKEKLIYEWENFDLKELTEECMAVALKEVCNHSVITNCKQLTEDSIFVHIVEDVQQICKYLDRLNHIFDDLYGAIKVYSTKAFIEHMISRVYELFVENYPYSKRSVYQLMKAMQSLQWYGREKLISMLIKEVKRKLLKMGVTTKAILTAYANVVECLTYFDPSSVLVHKVCEVIREYVTTRPETMKTIIRFITAERPGESDGKSGALILSEKHMEAVNDEYILAIEETSKNSWDKWMPDPYDANPNESRLFRQSADVFSMLVMIYGSKEMFVKEYRDFLAERLKINGWAILEHERTYINMMKNRFHDGELTSCDVMLRDIEHSRDISSEQLQNLDIRVISDVFWPTSRDIKVPEIPMLENIKKDYEKYFEKQKMHRKLRWFSSYGGYVKMNVGIGEKQVEIQVDMLQYSVIVMFLEQTTYTFDEIKANIELSNKELNEVIDWWVRMGCLSRDGSTISLVEDESSWSKLSTYAREQDKVNILDIMEPFWNYIRGILKMGHRSNSQHHAQQLTPERLLSTFTMFLTDDGPVPTLDDFGKVFTKNASWVDKDELLDVVYWGRQLLALILGLFFGLWPMTSFWGLATYVAITVFVFNHYVVSAQEQDPDEMTFMDIAKEGFGSAFATFLVIDYEDHYIPTVDLGIPNTERGHCKKTFGILKHALEHEEFNDVSWFVIADDDTLLSIPRLYRVLNCFPKTKKLILGERYGYGFSVDGLGGYDYPTGGAG